MALRGKKSGGLSSTTAALLTLFLFSAFFFSVAGSTTSTFGLCFSELQSCSEDAECANCIFDWGSANYDSSECAYYTVVASSTTSTSCESNGVRNCCFFEDGTANTCLQNSLMIDYWSCIMEANGCLLDDMPCYGTTTSSTSAELDVSIADDTELDVSIADDTELDVSIADDTELDVSIADDTELDVSIADDTYGSTRKTLSALASVLVTTVAALGLAV